MTSGLDERAKQRKGPLQNKKCYIKAYINPILTLIWQKFRSNIESLCMTSKLRLKVSTQKSRSQIDPKLDHFNSPVHVVLTLAVWVMHPLMCKSYWPFKIKNSLYITITEKAFIEQNNAIYRLHTHANLNITLRAFIEHNPVPEPSYDKNFRSNIESLCMTTKSRLKVCTQKPRSQIEPKLGRSNSTLHVKHTLAVWVMYP